MKSIGRSLFIMGWLNVTAHVQNRRAPVSRGTNRISTQDANGIRVDLRLPRILIVSGTDEKRAGKMERRTPFERPNGLELADDPGEILGKDRDQSRPFGVSAVGYFGHVMCQLTAYLYLIN